MSGINIDYDEVDRCISNLSKISTDYPTKEKTELSGEGCSISEIENIAKLYENFYTNIDELIAYTVSFLEGVKAKFVEQDQPK